MMTGIGRIEITTWNEGRMEKEKKRVERNSADSFETRVGSWLTGEELAWKKDQPTLTRPRQTTKRGENRNQTRLTRGGRMLCGLDDGRKSRDDDNHVSTIDGHGAYRKTDGEGGIDGGGGGGGGGGNWEPVEEKTRGRLRERKLKRSNEWTRGVKCVVC